MNIKYTLGNTLRNKTSFKEYKFPAEKPTCEWSGDEVRTYSNYRRPISNLFENDQELLNASENTFFGITKENDPSLEIRDDGILNGCTIGVTEYNNSLYFEVTPGAFVFNHKVYQVYPSCEACSKQIEDALVYLTSSEMSVHMSYDRVTKKYSGNITDNSGHVYATDKADYDTGYGLIVALNEAKCDGVAITKFITSNYKLEDFILLPIWKDLGVFYYLCFGGSLYTSMSLPPNVVVFGQRATSGKDISYDDATYFFLNGAILKDGTIPNTKILNNFLDIGEDRYYLGEKVERINGVESINGASVNFKNGVLSITTENGPSIKTTGNFELFSACSRPVTDDKGFIERAVEPTERTPIGDKTIPSSYAVQQYITNSYLTTNGSNTHRGPNRFENEVVFGSRNSGDTLLSINNSGVITNRNTTSASVTFEFNDGGIKQYNSTATIPRIVDAKGSEIIHGGLVVAGDIFAGLEIKGKNLQATSSRALKENIRDFDESAVDIINSADIKFFNYKSDNEKNLHIGIIADDTHEYIATKNHDSLDMVNSIGLLFKAVQELSAENKALKEELNAIKSGR